MPDTIRRELLGYGERQYPAAEVTLIGPPNYINVWYWPRQGSIHFVGSPGPRGGARTACGQRAPARWTTRQLRLPPQRHTALWTNTCPNCKEAVGIA